MMLNLFGTAVEPHELIISAATGAIFGLLGYFVTRYIHDALTKVV